MKFDLRAEVAAERQALREAYLRRPNPRALLGKHTQLVDRTARAVWGEAAVATEAALVATGGYGRGELFPSSDIDLLVLLGADPSEAEREALERLIGRLWDIGLEIGHSVRTVEGCAEAAAGDVTIRTTLLESRFLVGNRALFRQLEQTLVFDPVAFFKAKKLEQEQRHAKHQDSPYALEPNLKEAPGGLRDLQIIQWIARASGMGRCWTDLVAHKLIQRDEASQLSRLERHLHDLRIRLHYLAGRREDRLVFDLQTALAKQLGYEDTPARLASEAMMQRYYRTAQSVTQLNTILLQNLEARLAPRPDTAPRPLNERFEVRSELLHIRQEATFGRTPSAILECFLLMMQHPELRGMTARTLRALWRARRLVNGKFRRDPIARLLFLHILQQPRGIVHEFRRMNQYGILGRYLPEFARATVLKTFNAAELVVADARAAMAHAAVAFFDDPTATLQVAGVTSTSGKTTTAFLLYEILAAAGREPGLLGTIETRVGRERRPAIRTTAEAIDLQRTFNRMLEQGDEACAMEVSSHALALHRADAIHFAVKVFTNLSQDHLDFHADMEDYFAAKMRLFGEVVDDGGVAVVWADDAWSERAIAAARAPRRSRSIPRCSSAA